MEQSDSGTKGLPDGFDIGARSKWLILRLAGA